MPPAPCAPSHTHPRPSLWPVYAPQVNLSNIGDRCWAHVGHVATAQLDRKRHQRVYVRGVGMPCFERLLQLGRVEVIDRR